MTQITDADRIAWLVRQAKHESPHPYEHNPLTDGCRSRFKLTLDLAFDKETFVEAIDRQILRQQKKSL